MYRVLTADGAELFVEPDFIVARSRLRTTPRAHRIESAEGVLLSWRPPHRDWDCLAEVGRDAGKPYGVEAAICVGMN